MIVVYIVRPQEASWCERLIADHAVASLEAGLRSVEITSRLLLLHGSLILLSEDKAGLLEEHIGGFWCLCLRLGNAVYEAREVNLLGLLGLRWGNILDEALLDLGSKTANQD